MKRDYKFGYVKKKKPTNFYSSKDTIENRKIEKQKNRKLKNRKIEK